MKQDKKETGVWQLLRRNISAGQLIGYSAANAVGLIVVLVGLIFYLDSGSEAKNQEQFFSRNYAVISKVVDGIGFDPVAFTESEIADIEKQPWAKNVGRFTASQFTVYGSVNLGGRGLGTYLFLESIPDEFFDVKPNEWDFDPAEGFIPVIINKDYLTLYNFGFAVPQGLPQLSEKVIGSIPLSVRLTGEDMHPEYFEAAIVGFSTRLNTIAVPQSFMDWANERFYVGNEPAKSSRLIIEIDALQMDAMNSYLAEHGYEQAGDKEGEGKISKFLGVVSGVVTVNGMVICALAIFILLLSIFLLLQQSRDKLNYLMLLGYSPQSIGKYYLRMVVIINTVITLIAITVTVLARGLWAKPLGEIGIGDASLTPIFVVAVAYLLLVNLINAHVIRKRMLNIWHNR